MGLFVISLGFGRVRQPWSSAKIVEAEDLGDRRGNQLR
jgi:hypothetical protein